MKMEKMNMPPRPYRWSVRLPLLQGWGLSIVTSQNNLLQQPVHEWDGYKSHEDHDGSDSDGCVFGRSFAQARCDEQVGRVIEDCIDARELK